MAKLSSHQLLFNLWCILSDILYNICEFNIDPIALGTIFQDCEIVLSEIVVQKFQWGDFKYVSFGV